MIGYCHVTEYSPDYDPEFSISEKATRYAAEFTIAYRKRRRVAAKAEKNGDRVPSDMVLRFALNFPPQFQMIRVGKILIYPERKLLILFKTSLSGTNLTAFSQPGRKAQDD